MANKAELRERIIRAYCAINDVLSVDWDGVEPKGKDIGLAAVMMIARNAIHWALDIVDYDLTGRPASEPRGPRFGVPGPALRIVADKETPAKTEPKKEPEKYP